MSDEKLRNWPGGAAGLDGMPGSVEGVVGALLAMEDVIIDLLGQAGDHDQRARIGQTLEKMAGDPSPAAADEPERLKHYRRALGRLRRTLPGDELPAATSA